MVLEATMICLDNSEWSRNGDFAPNRLDAQQDTANLLCGSKTQANPENAVGLLHMGGSRVGVAVAPTSDMAVFLQALHGIPAAGISDFIRGIQTAQLALKHRLNRNQRQRIVLFVCSPLQATEKQLEALGKSLKKNNVSLDIVSFGQVAENSRLLQKLYLSVNSNDSSHLVEVPDTSISLTRAVMQSAIVSLDSNMSGAGRDGGGVDDFGVDPSADPELYMALRLSLEDERVRSQREQQETQRVAELRSGHEAGLPTETSPVGEAPAPGTAYDRSNQGPVGGVSIADTPSLHETPEDKPPTIEEINAMDIDHDLRQALLLSLRDFNAGQDPATAAAADVATKRPAVEPSGDVLTEAALSKRRKTEGSSSSLEFRTPQSEISAQADGGSNAQSDNAMVEEIIKNLSGVNFENPQVQNALRMIPPPARSSKDVPPPERSSKDVPPPERSSKDEDKSDSKADEFDNEKERKD